ncbi:MAG: hypothetical protein ACI8Y8_000672 [Planctomycetota bacterium]|jgi:hypothetical protein
MDDRRTLRACGWCIFVSALLRLALAGGVTGFVLVDDAYITLRYARMANETGALVYNVGEAVFGVTSPLWGLVTTGLYAIAGRAWIAELVIGLGILLWSLTAWRIARALPARTRLLTVLVFLWSPVFVDNQLLGMETPMVVWLAVGAMTAALDGRLRAAAGWTGWLIVARPEGVLFAPALLIAAASRSGWRPALRELVRPASLALLLAPVLAWMTYALTRYGAVLPQSMVAKSGWNSSHYDTLATASAALLALPRLTFLPFVDYLPAPLPIAIAATTLVAVLWIVRVNVRAGTSASRAWLVFYLTYITFYLVGKGATEASWYAVPPSVALLLAAEPAWPRRWIVPPVRLVGALACTLAIASVGLVLKRAPLLESYVAGYGRCAEALNEELAGRPTVDNPVLIGEIGVFGFVSDHRVIDVGALVSPQVLPLKNDDASLLSIARATGARWLVVSEVALERNHYPSVGPVWADEEEHDWLNRCPLIFQARDKLLFQLVDPALVQAH